MPLWCTKCGKDTHVEPDTSRMYTKSGRMKRGMSKALAAICENWMCNDCLTYEEEIQSQTDTTDTSKH